MLVFEIKDFFKIAGSAELQETQIQVMWEGTPGFACFLDRIKM